MADPQDREQQKYDRRAQALRANLRRRKQQKKQRASDGASDRANDSISEDIAPASDETVKTRDPAQM